MDKKELAKLMVKEECTSDMKVSDVFKRTNEIYTELGGKGSVYFPVDIAELQLVEKLKINQLALFSYYMGSSFRYVYLTLRNKDQLTDSDTHTVQLVLDTLKYVNAENILLHGLSEEYLDYLHSKGIKVY